MVDGEGIAIRSELFNRSNGATQKNISQTVLKKIASPLPHLPGQHRIVAEIERRISVTDEIEKTIDQSLKQAESLRQSILQRAFGDKLVPHDANDEPASVLLEQILLQKKINEKNNKPKRRKTRGQKTR
ncbi:MAG: restriction endonuclease subunit S [Euryarchaeota archaeon]|nr:restriction endonuclease subunit S [Euryarchaeota archaeon]